MRKPTVQTALPGNGVVPGRPHAPSVVPEHGAVAWRRDVRTALQEHI